MTWPSMALKKCVTSSSLTQYKSFLPLGSVALNPMPICSSPSNRRKWAVREVPHTVEILRSIQAVLPLLLLGHEAFFSFSGDSRHLLGRHRYEAPHDSNVMVIEPANTQRPQKTEEFHHQGACLVQKREKGIVAYCEQRLVALAACTIRPSAVDVQNARGVADVDGVVISIRFPHEYDLVLAEF